MRGIVWLAALVASALGVLITPSAVARSLAAMSWSPTTKGGYDFKWLTVGQSVSQRFTLTNRSSSTSGSVKVAILGSQAFRLVADGCKGRSLGPTAKCRVTVAYSPGVAGSSDAATLIAAANGVFQASVALTGSSIAVGAGHVYWTQSETNTIDTIGRAGLDGSSPNPSFIANASAPPAVAVDSGHVYWTNIGTNSIGRANLDGSNPNQSFITGVFGGVAVNSGHIYWGEYTAIGRANLDGSHVNHTFITGVNAYWVAVDSGHIYWTSLATGKIGRANLDGSHRQQSFIATAQTPCGVAVDSGHVYWVNGPDTNTIGRANLDGSHRQQNFITGASNPCGVAVGDGRVYWGEGSAIGRANLNGSNVNHSFITGATNVAGMAVGPG